MSVGAVAGLSSKYASVERCFSCSEEIDMVFLVLIAVDVFYGKIKKNPSIQGKRSFPP